MLNGPEPQPLPEQECATGEESRVSARIFYSWQSDVRAAACRTLIQEALQGAVARLAQDGSIKVDPVIDATLKAFRAAARR